MSIDRSSHATPTAPSPGTIPGALLLGGAHGSLAVARSLGSRGIPVWFVTSDHPLPSLSRFVRRSFAWDGPDRDNAAPWLIELARRHNLQGWVLIACGDPEVHLVAQHHADLSAAFRVTTPPWEITQVAYNKRLTYERADATDVAYPRDYRPRSRIELAAIDCQFPVVLKPTSRKSPDAFTRAKGWKALDRTELMTLYDRAAALVGEDAIVLQEFVPGAGESQFSYAALWDRGQPVASLVARRTRQFPIEFGYTSTFVETVENRDVEESSVRYLHSLNYSGLVELEYKFDERDGRYKLLDFNARPWTWIALGTAAGVDFPYLAWQLATGDHVVPVRGRAGVRWMHFARDLVSAGQHMLAGRLTLGGYLRSFRRPLTFAAFAWNDPVPGFFEVPLTVYRAVNRRVPFIIHASNGIRAALSGTSRFTSRFTWRAG